MTHVVSPIPALLARLLAQPGAHLVDHHESYDEWAVVGFGNARIGLQWHHQESSSSISPSFGVGPRYLTFAYAVACYVAGEVVEPMQGVEGEIDFIVNHLDEIRAICDNENAWVEFCRTTDRMLGLPDLFATPSE